MSIVSETRSRNSISFGIIFGEILPAALVGFLLAAVGVMHVTSRVMVVSLGYELSRLDGQQTELLRENDALKVELATVKSPARLESTAKGKIGLVAPPGNAMFTVKRD